MPFRHRPHPTLFLLSPFGRAAERGPKRKSYAALWAAFRISFVRSEATNTISRPKAVRVLCGQSKILWSRIFHLR